jgi:hypothetical protein
MKHRNLIFKLLLLILISNYKIYSQECESYKVMEIDSTKSYYLILVNKNEIKSLIVSSKKRTRPKNRISISKSFNFKLLKSNLTKDIPINLIDIPKSLIIEGKVIWTSKDDFNVYTTKNLKGLNYVKKCDCPID